MNDIDRRVAGRITDEQNEIIARAMGVLIDDHPGGKYYIFKGEVFPGVPRFDVPGELHEKMVRKFTVEGNWIEKGARYLAWAFDDLSYQPERHESRPIAEFLAVLAYLTWINEREE